MIYLVAFSTGDLEIAGAQTSLNCDQIFRDYRLKRRGLVVKVTFNWTVGAEEGDISVSVTQQATGGRRRRERYLSLWHNKPHWMICKQYFYQKVRWLQNNDHYKCWTTNTNNILLMRFLLHHPFNENVLQQTFNKNTISSDHLSKVVKTNNEDISRLFWTVQTHF